ncbi:hypothetical protein B0H11DRAFT_2075135 [Mycena galericulata]|nr:hypothetical protein B0H11DRAFT_2075135 [Mycena galericulata]
MIHALPLKINTNTLGVQEEVISLSTGSAPPSGTDIHDVNRKKIEFAIRPRCKEYAQKQRSIRTLACFAAKSTTDPADSPPDSIAEVKPPSFKKARTTPTKPRAMIASGRIEKPPRSPPRKAIIIDIPVDAPAVVAVAQPEYELYSCGCSMPSDCRQCILRRLADKFCAIVAARKERIRQSESMAMFS